MILSTDKIKKWQVLASKYLISRAPWLTIREDKVVLTDGRIMESYYVSEYPDWVAVIAVTKDGKHVMTRQYRHGLGEINFELAAGIQDPEDSGPLAAARRELLEESGFGGGSWKLWTVSSANPGTHTNLVHIYLATNVYKITEPHLDELEELEVHLLDVDKVFELLENNHVRQSLHAQALWKYFYHFPVQQNN